MSDMNRRPPRRDGPSQGNGQGGNRPAGRRPHYRSRRRRGAGQRVLSGPQVVYKYHNLLDLHLQNRRKYFEMFSRADDNQLRKLENNFYASIEQLRRFEERLEDWQKEYLRQNTDRYRKDLTYQTNHNLPDHYPLEVRPEDIRDPHFTPAQEEAFEEYRNDKEEGVGTYEDYVRYKESKS